MTSRTQSSRRDPLVDLLRGSGSLPAAGDSSWEAFADDCVASGLAGVALTLLAESGRLGDLPPRARAVLDAELNRVRVAQAVLFHRFEALVNVMRESGVEFVVHKGGALCALVYQRHEDRPMVDIDVIFRPDDWMRVREAVLSAGYRLPEGALQTFWLENYFNLAMRSPEDPPSHFDLHWSLTQEGRYHIDTREIMSRAIPYRLGEVDLLRLSDEDLLLSLFLHLAYHYFDAQLIWLYDMKRVVERFAIDWDLLLRRAAGWGLMAVVSFNFEYLDKLFPGLVPPEVAARARSGPMRRALALPLLSTSSRHLFRAEENRLNQFAIGLIAIDRPADAARFAADKLSRSLKWLGRRPSRR